MKRLENKKMAKYAVLLAILVTSGCGKAGAIDADQAANGSQQGNVPSVVDMNTPITLKIYSQALQTTFDLEVTERIKQKFPNVTIELLGDKNGIEKSLTQHIINNNIPDLLWLPKPNDVQIVKDLGLAYDLNGLIGKNKFDLSRFDDAALENARRQGDNGEMYVIPWQVEGFTMFYNLDIFDRFGIEYPKDGMTWPEVLELGKRLTRTDNGVNYRGFDPGYYPIYKQQFGLSVYDWNTGKTTFATDPKWKTILDFLRTAYQVPGNYPADNKVVMNRSAFCYSMTVAMLPWSAYFQPFIDARKTGLNFNVVSLPTWPDAPGRGTAGIGAAWAVSSKSQHKDQAFEIIKFLTSDEVEIANSRIGFAPALKLQTAKDQFGADLPGIEGINVKAVFKLPFTPVPKTVPLLETAAEQFMFTVISEAGSGAKDPNTALREIQELADKELEKQKK
ncbi:ABC transporter substrate-binding protein [Paenibacillus hodogayensis]|uniref:ABC transporter substrate-binding protein n=1 Tax=Paenibacillus hodogayensis TaxID=279208 RepID=A0ABV5W3H8_9BACL